MIGALQTEHAFAAELKACETNESYRLLASRLKQDLVLVNGGRVLDEQYQRDVGAFARACQQAAHRTQPKSLAQRGLPTIMAAFVSAALRHQSLLSEGKLSEFVTAVLGDGSFASVMQCVGFTIDAVASEWIENMLKNSHIGMCDEFAKCVFNCSAAAACAGLLGGTIANVALDYLFAKFTGAARDMSQEEFFAYLTDSTVRGGIVTSLGMMFQGLLTSAGVAATGPVAWVAVIGVSCVCGFTVADLQNSARLKGTSFHAEVWKGVCGVPRYLATLVNPRQHIVHQAPQETLKWEWDVPINVECPNELCCPICSCPCGDDLLHGNPVIAGDNDFYCKKCLVRTVRRFQRDPLTNMPMTLDSLVLNLNTKKGEQIAQLQMRMQKIVMAWAARHQIEIQPQTAI